MNEKEADERKRPIYIYTFEASDARSSICQRPRLTGPDFNHSLIDSNDEQYEVGPAHVYTRSHAYSSITLNIR